jgi:hypothetical protein
MVKRYNRKGEFHMSKWTGPADTVTWHVTLDRPGRYEVSVRYAANEESDGREFLVESGDTGLTGRVGATGGWYEYRTEAVGVLDLPAGDCTVTLRPKTQAETDLMYLGDVSLRCLTGES